MHYNKARAETGAALSSKIARFEENSALTVIQNDQNYGFAEGNNIAVAYALSALNPDYVLLLNNDTVVEKDFLDELVNAAEHDGQIGLLQPKILRSVDSTIESTGIMCDTLAYSKPRGLYEKKTRDNTIMTGNTGFFTERRLYTDQKEFASGTFKRVFRSIPFRVL